MLKTLSFLAFLCLVGNSFSQEIPFKNPSFEGIHGPGHTPRKWYACESQYHSPPDIQPGSYGCKTAPSDGKAYLGMVIRDDLTFEGVGQPLSYPLDSGQWYRFSADLAKSPDYWSSTRFIRIADPKTGASKLVPNGEIEINHTQPVVFQVWGGYKPCDLEVLLAETPPVEHTDWKTYTFNIRHDLSKPITHLIFQAYFLEKDRCIGAHGNVLLDNLSALKIIPDNDRLPKPKALVREAKKNATSPDLVAVDSILKTTFNTTVFKSDYPYFEMHCNTDETGLMFTENSALEKVAELLSQHQSLRVTIAVKKRYAEVLIPFLQDYFIQRRKLSHAQIGIAKFEKRDENLAVFENEFIKVMRKNL